MSLTVNCPQCGRHYSVPEERAGKRFRCQQCRSIVLVPHPERDPWDLEAPEEAPLPPAVPALRPAPKKQRASLSQALLPPRRGASLGQSTGQPSRKKPSSPVDWISAGKSAAWGAGSSFLIASLLLFGGKFAYGKITRKFSTLRSHGGKPAAASLQSFPAGERAGAEWEANGLKMKFNWCPPGEATLGSPTHEAGRGTDEEPVPVSFSRGFWIARYEVTQAEYEAVMKENPSRLSPYSFYRMPKVVAGGEDFSRWPVEMVTWGDALVFCYKLTVDERRAGRLPLDWEYSLPTEAQWEYACRAGTTSATSFGESLCGGEANIDTSRPYRCSEAARSVIQLRSVGVYPANAWGLHDMHGNVREWCADPYHPQLVAEGESAPTPADFTELRVVRGGDAGTSGAQCRSASRSSLPLSAAEFRLGFRVVLRPAEAR